MIESLIFQSVSGASLEFQEDQTTLMTTGGFTITEFAPGADIRRMETPRPEQHGIQPAYTYLGKGTFHQEGDILYNDPSLYIQKRMDFLNVLFGALEFDPFAPISRNRKLGTLTIQFTDQELMETPDGVTIDGYPEIPMRALYPATTPYMITWVSFTPYLIGLSSGQYYLV